MVIVESAPDPDAFAEPDAFYADAFAAANPTEFHAFKKQNRGIIGMMRGGGSRSTGTRTIFRRCTTKSSAKTTRKKKNKCPKTKTKRRCACRCKRRKRTTTTVVSLAKQIKISDLFFLIFFVTNDQNNYGFS